MATKTLTKGSGSASQKKKSKTTFKATTPVKTGEKGTVKMTASQRLNLGKTGSKVTAQPSQKSATRGSVQPQQKKASNTKRTLSKASAGTAMAQSYRVVVS